MISSRLTYTLLSLFGVIAVSDAGAGSALAEAQPPSRQVTVSGSMHIHDHDDWSGCERGTFALPTTTMFLNNNSVQELFETDECVDKEVRGELELNAQLLSGGDVRISGEMLLYEGASCSTNDLDGKHTFSFTVPKGEIKNWRKRLRNRAEGGDFIIVRMNVGNFDAEEAAGQR